MFAESGCDLKSLLSDNRGGENDCFMRFFAKTSTSLSLSLSCVRSAINISYACVNDGVPLSRALTINPSATAMKPLTSEMNNIDSLLPVEAVRS